MYRKNLSIFCSKYSSVFVRQAAVESSFTTSESWVILSRIEQRIKSKIEAMGKPLKDWEINIYRGVLTGYNEAFIIDGNKKAELISEDPKSVEIIRPILRGRDITRYGYDFADLWLINTHNGIKARGIKPVNINDYPAIKRWLDYGGIAYNGKIYEGFKQMEKRADQGDTPYNLRNCAYMDDFSKQKIVWGEISDTTKFCIDLNGEFVTEATTFLMTGQSLFFLFGYLNSKLSEYLFSKIGTTTGVGTIRWKKYTIEKLHAPKVSPERQNKYDIIVRDIIGKQKKKHEFGKQLAALNRLIYQDFQLTSEEVEFIEAQ